VSEPVLVLASASPRRRELIGQLGVEYIVRTSGADETPLPDETPQAHTTRLAQAKAEAVAREFADRWVLGADTAVVIDGLLLGKPVDEQDAFRMLRLISGRWHTVVTGICVMHRAAGRRHVHCEESAVFIRPLTDTQIRAYVATGEPLDKAGAYAIQGVGAGLVQKVRGSYTNVVGLPLAEFAILWEQIHGEDVLVKAKK